MNILDKVQICQLLRGNGRTGQSGNNRHIISARGSLAGSMDISPSRRKGRHQQNHRRFAANVRTPPMSAVPRKESAKMPLS